MKLQTISSLAPLAILSLLSPALAQAEEAYYVANRTSQDVQKISACGALLGNFNLSASLRAAYTAPDGKVWVQKFITTSFIIMDADGKNQKTINANGGAFPVDILFDAQGNGLVLVTGRTSTPLGVQVYDKDGKYQKIFPITTASPLGMALDTAGNIWIGHRVGPPTSITKIDIKTGKTTVFTAPSSTKTLGGNIAIDKPSITSNGNIWTVGDRANELLELNPHVTPAKWTTHFPDGNATTFGSLAVDGNNTLWLSDWSSGRLVHWDIKTKKALTTIMLQRPLGIAIDGRGHVLVTSDLGGSSVMNRYHPVTHLLEQSTKTGNRPGRGPRSNFQFARQNMLIGDADGDGSNNLSELNAGTSLFDAQSNSQVDVRIIGSHKLGSTVDIKVGGTTPFALGFALKLLPKPASLSAWKGDMRIDPTTLALLFLGKAPFELKGIKLPTNSSAIGLTVHQQALYEHSKSQPAEWSNDTCVSIF